MHSNETLAAVSAMAASSWHTHNTKPEKPTTMVQLTLTTSNLPADPPAGKPEPLALIQTLLRPDSSERNRFRGKGRGEWCRVLRCHTPSAWVTPTLGRTKPRPLVVDCHDTEHYRESAAARTNTKTKAATSTQRGTTQSVWPYRSGADVNLNCERPPCVRPTEFSPAHFMSNIIKLDRFGA